MALSLRKATSNTMVAAAKLRKAQENVKVATYAERMNNILNI